MGLPIKKKKINTLVPVSKRDRLQEIVRFFNQQSSEKLTATEVLCNMIESKHKEVNK